MHRLFSAFGDFERRSRIVHKPMRRKRQTLNSAFSALPKVTDPSGGGAPTQLRQRRYLRTMSNSPGITSPALTFDNKNEDGRIKNEDGCIEWKLDG
jgi:hypothetical protein